MQEDQANSVIDEVQNQTVEDMPVDESAEHGALEENQEEKQVSGELPDDFKGRLARERKRHDKEILELKRQNEQMMLILQNQQRQSQVPQQAPANPSPQQDSGQDELDRKVEEKLQRMLLQVNEQNTQQEINKKYLDLVAKVDEADKSDLYPDFREVVRDQSLPLPEAFLKRLALSIPDSVNPADVLYNLAKDREKLSRIVNLHPDLQSAEVAKISAEIMVNKRPAQKTNAPAPSTSLSSMPNLKTSRINSNSSIEELRKILT